ncbi:MAG: glycosyltransferase family 2 protein [Alcanivoracaceae bacterium]
MSISIVIPAKNESASLPGVISRIRALHPHAEVIVVDDGSTDNTATSANDAGAKVISHPYSKGNGAAIKTGARNASKDVIIFMDGDGQHRPEDIQILLDRLKDNVDMVVGSRDANGQASASRHFANRLYNRLASWMTGQTVRDLTSGFRAVRREKFLEFLYLLPNGFSYPTTITMSFFRAGYSVVYQPIAVQARMEGTSSHINLTRDGIRFFLIIFKVGTLYSPLKLFLPISFLFFALGSVYYAYTYLLDGRFTNMGALLFITSVLVFLIGLVSEQITALMYKDD